MSLRKVKVKQLTAYSSEQVLLFVMDKVQIYHSAIWQFIRQKDDGYLKVVNVSMLKN